MLKQRSLLTCTALVILAAGFVSTVSAGEKNSPVYEIRTYTTNDGKLPALHNRFKDHTIALFKKQGIENVIYWVPEDKENTLVYIIAHKSVKARNKTFKAFLDDPAWKKAYKESIKNGKLVANVESQFLVTTDYSPKTFAAAKPGWIYELRTYTTNAGKLPNLNARFRDHTIALFEKHGIHNALYTTPTKTKNTLVYVIAHKSRKAADASWKAFGQDPAWKKVAKESQLDGRILVKGGVKRQYLNTTDYSPIK